MTKTIALLIIFLISGLPNFTAPSLAVADDTEKSILQMMDKEISPDEKDNSGKGEFKFEWADNQQHSGRKSALKAGALSLILPGAGAYYLGNKSRAAIFFGTEAAIWGGYFAFRAWGNWKEDDYKSFAAEHAGANIDGKDDKFFERMQFYNSRDWFNIEEGYRYGGAYPNSDYYYWHWDSSASQKEYRSIRNASKAAFRNATFMIGVAAVNRVVSFVDAIRIAKKLNKANNVDIYGGWKLDYKTNPFGHNPSASVKLVKAIN